MEQTTWAAVAAERIQRYEQNNVQEKIDQILDSLSIKEQLHPKQHVLIKPNLLMKRRPEEATTAHPAVVEAVVRYLQGAGIETIVIADSPGGPYTKPLLRGIYEATGMAQVCKNTGAVLNEEVGFQAVPALNGRQCTSFHLIDPVAEADVVISIGKLKTHCMTTLSGGVKNLFGCIPGLQKPELHYRFQDKKAFCRMLVDLAQTVSPLVTIIDGIIGMEGDGPSAGQPIHSGFLAASTSPFVLDRYLCELIGFLPKEAPTVEESIERGLCPQQTEKIPLLSQSGMPKEIPFKKPSSKSVDFMSYVPRVFAPVVRAVKDSLLTPRPKVDKKACIGCGRCAESCPAKTIAIENKKASIRYDRCIRCYCCHEMCPVKAIHVQRVKLFDL